jgi:hypothetical protein
LRRNSLELALQTLNLCLGLDDVLIQLTSSIPVELPAGGQRRRLGSSGLILSSVASPERQGTAVPLDKQTMPPRFKIGHAIAGEGRGCINDNGGQTRDQLPAPNGLPFLDLDDLNPPAHRVFDRTRPVFAGHLSRRNDGARDLRQQTPNDNQKDKAARNGARLDQ